MWESEEFFASFKPERAFENRAFVDILAVFKCLKRAVIFFVLLLGFLCVFTSIVAFLGLYLRGLLRSQA